MHKSPRSSVSRSPESTEVFAPSSTTFLLWFGIVLLCHLSVVWAPVWPFGQDSVAWIEMLDIAGRYHDPSTIYQKTYHLHLFMEPNSLALSSAWWLGGNISSVHLVRGWLSFYVVGTPLAILALCRAFQRSPWLALASSPLVFGAMYTVGLLNYLISIPFLLGALALARLYALRGGALKGLALALCLTLLFHAHLFGFLVGAGLCCVVLLASIRRWRGLLRMWVFLPASMPFAFWIMRKLVLQEKTAHGAAFLNAKGRFGFVYRSIGWRVDRLFHDSTHMFLDSKADDALFFYLLGLCLLLFLIGKRQDFLALQVPETLGWWGDLRAWLDKHLLGVLVGFVLLAYLFLPSHMHDMYLIAERLPILLLLLLFASQRVVFVGAVASLLVPVVAVSIAYPLFVSHRTSTYMREHVGPLITVFAKMPPKSKVHVVDLRPYNRVFSSRALWYVVKSLNAVYTGGLTDVNFARTPYNAVGYRRGMFPPRAPGRSLSGGSLFLWDYLVICSPKEPLEAQRHPALQHIFRLRYWWIYRVLRSEREDVIVRGAGGSGGIWSAWDCPKGFVLRGFSGEMGHSLARILPQCRKEKGQRERFSGPPFGRKPKKGESFRQLCAPNQYVVGLYGYADHLVRGWGVYCGVPHSHASSRPSSLPKDRPLRAWQQILRRPPVGEVQGKWFEQFCPQGQVAVGFRGYVGDVVDAVGISCAKKVAP